jgi:biotin carboxyl carrier protein
MTEKQSSAWFERIEEIVHLLAGSTVGELELREGETEIIIRRHPGLVLTAAGPQIAGIAPGRAEKENHGLAILAPLTGVYFAAASPNTPPFVSIGDTVQAGQVVALIEAMKVFNEVLAEASGCVTAILPTNGTVVQKGDVLLHVEPG